MVLKSPLILKAVHSSPTLARRKVGLRLWQSGETQPLLNLGRQYEALSEPSEICFMWRHRHFLSSSLLFSPLITSA